MARFVFRYRTLLKQAVATENLRQRDLAAVLRKQLILQNQLREMQQTIRDSKQQLGERLVGKVDLTAVREVARFTGDSSARGRQIVQRLAGLEKSIEVARAALTEAMRRRKSLETLREKDHQRWLLDERRRETAELDEVAAQAFIRRVIGGVA